MGPMTRREYEEAMVRKSMERFGVTEAEARKSEELKQKGSRL